MRRDMDLFRMILLHAESGVPSLSDVSEGTLKYHQALAIEAGLLKGKILSTFVDSGDVPAAVVVQGVTWDGHDFIDAIREDTNWHRVKSYLTDAGKQVTIETVKAAITALFGFAVQ